jgi:serine/threonine protein kinase
MKIANKYIIQNGIGQGNFGSVFKAVCLKTEKLYAAKLENVESSFGLIKHEAAILFYLNTQKCTHLPYIYYYGKQIPYNCLVMTYYEGSLEEIGNTLTLHEKMKWWNTMLKTIEGIHDAGIVHRDIKPAHFMRDSLNEWNLIDFGMATSFLKDSQHIEEVQKEHIIGSPNYVSYHVHMGKDVVPRDDFISLIYIFWELLYGTFLDEIKDEVCSSHYKKEHVSYPYNLWLKEQKSWERLFSLQKQNQNDVCSEMVVGLLMHGQYLRFKDKPNYDNFIIEFTAE